MVILQHLAYAHADKHVLFTGIHFTVNRHDKVAIVGSNGSGKSTLLRIIAREALPSAGQLTVDTKPYYVPQIFGQYNHLTVAQALHVDAKINALHAILNGATDLENFNALNDDWTIEERCREALAHWRLDSIALSQPLETLSGGQKVKVFLAGIALHKPELVLLDEPTNHLDAESRALLYDFVRTTDSTLIIVSHDRTLLNLCTSICALDHRGITVYGGNYDFFAAQKQQAKEALSEDILDKEKALRKAREKKRETLERQQRSNARGKSKQEKAGIARILMKTLRNTAESTSARLKDAHDEKIGSIAEELKQLQANLPGADKIRFGFDNSSLHKGKVLFRAERINFSYGTQPLWEEDISFEIVSGERILLQGENGSGKTTLLQLITGALAPTTGTVYRAFRNAVYIDQEYSLIDPALTVYAQAQQFNTSALQPHEINTRLSRFLFAPDDWQKPCAALSGGERMRLLLCCLTIRHRAPELIILDEPTNNLDLESVEILERAMEEYEGTVMMVGHGNFSST